MEEQRDGAMRLLLFDPSCNRRQMAAFHEEINANLMRTVRRTLHSMRAKQYQIVAVVGILTDKEYEVSRTGARSLAWQEVAGQRLCRCSWTVSVLREACLCPLEAASCKERTFCRLHTVRFWTKCQKCLSVNKEEKATVSVSLSCP